MNEETPQFAGDSRAYPSVGKVSDTSVRGNAAFTVEQAFGARAALSPRRWPVTVRRGAAAFDVAPRSARAGGRSDTRRSRS